MTWDLQKIMENGVETLLLISIPVALGLLLIMQTASFIIIRKEQSNNGVKREKPFFPNVVWGALAAPYLLFLLFAIINPGVSWGKVFLYAVLPPAILYFYVRFSMYIFYKPAHIKGRIFHETIAYIFLAPFILMGKVGIFFFCWATQQKMVTTERWEITWSDGSKTHEDRTNFVGCVIAAALLVLGLAVCTYIFVLIGLPILPGFAIVALYYFLRNFVLKEAHHNILRICCGAALSIYFILAIVVVLSAMKVF